MTDVEIVNKEIRGLTAKNIVWFMGGIIGVLITVMWTYFSIIRKLDGITILQTNQSIISTKVENNTKDINELRQRIIPSLDKRMSIMEEKMNDKIFIKSAP